MSEPVLITARELIKSGIAGFLRSYGDRPDFLFADGRSAKEVADALRALDPDTCSAAEVDGVIRSKYWCTVACNGCGSRVHDAVRVGDDPEDIDSRTATLCLSCLEKAWKASQRFYPGATVFRGSTPYVLLLKHVDRWLAMPKIKLHGPWLPLVRLFAFEESELT